MKNLVAELQWRGLVHDIMPGTEEQLLKESDVGSKPIYPADTCLFNASSVPGMMSCTIPRHCNSSIKFVGIRILLIL